MLYHVHEFINVLHTWLDRNKWHKQLWRCQVMYITNMWLQKFQTRWSEEMGDLFKMYHFNVEMCDLWGNNVNAHYMDHCGTIVGHLRGDYDNVKGHVQVDNCHTFWATICKILHGMTVQYLENIMPSQHVTSQKVKIMMLY